MTIEKHYALKSPLTPLTISTEQEDNGIRIFIKDKKGNVFFLLSAIRKSINIKDNELYNYGLFVTNFEYAPCIKDCPIFNEALNVFVNYANYAMFVTGNGAIMARYRYVWAKYNINDKCEFAKLFGLIPIDNEADLIIYKCELKN